MRQEFSFNRTSCACPDCSVSCRFVPGYLVPDDLLRLYIAVNDGWPVFDARRSMLEWAERHLRASPGALVAREDERTNRMTYFRIPTLVPATQDGLPACHWLAKDGKCQVHDNAPFGCAFMDAHMGEAEGTNRSAAGLRAIAEDFRTNGMYASVWIHLHARGLIAASPEEKRAAMQKEIGTPYPITTENGSA